MKFVVPVLVFVAAVGIFFATRKAPRKVEIETPASRPAITQDSIGHPQQSSLTETNSLQTSPARSETNSNAGTENAEAKIEALTDASMQSDAQSFQIIVNALKDERKEVRQAAVDAAIQFGSRDAIPFLEEAAAKIDDPREKIEMLDAIDFLKLPSFSETRPLRTNATPLRKP